MLYKIRVCAHLLVVVVVSSGRSINRYMLACGEREERALAIAIAIAQSHISKLLCQDVDDQGAPAGEWMRTLALAGLGVVLLPHVARQLVFLCRVMSE